MPFSLSSTQPEEWCKLREFTSTGRQYWQHLSTGTVLVTLMTDTHPCNLNPGDDFNIIDASEFPISIAMFTNIDRLPHVSLPYLIPGKQVGKITLHEALWLSQLLNLTLALQSSDGDEFFNVTQLED